jgi:hypothetical protein
MLIAIPSKGRAGETKSDRFLTSAVLFVPVGEVDQYRKHTRSEVIGVPNEVKGITATRNWILKNSEERRVVMLDDDLKNQGWTKLYKNNGKQKKLTEAEWLFEFERLFDVVEDLGWRIWGVKTEAALRSVHPFKPINFRSYVTASCMGIVNDKTFLFDESFPVKEDYEICLRHVEQFGGIVAARYLHWENSHWGDDGGCKSYRTQKIEAKAIRDLVAKYPNRIKRITRGGSEYSIELNL